MVGRHPVDLGDQAASTAGGPENATTADRSGDTEAEQPHRRSLIGIVVLGLGAWQILNTHGGGNAPTATETAAIASSPPAAPPSIGNHHICGGADVAGRLHRGRRDARFLAPRRSRGIPHDQRQPDVHRHRTRVRLPRSAPHLHHHQENRRLARLHRLRRRTTGGGRGAPGERQVRPRLLGCRPNGAGRRPVRVRAIAQPESMPPRICRRSPSGR